MDQITASASGNGRKSSKLRRGVTFAISIVVIVIMLYLVDWAAFWDVLSRLSTGSLVSAFAVYLLLNFWRTLRYQVLLEKRLPIHEVFLIGLYHNLLVRLLPFKLGEMTYIVLMRDRLNIAIQQGVSSLFGARILELLVIVVVGVAARGMSDDLLGQIGWFAYALIVLIVLVILFGVYFAGHILRLIIGILDRLGLPRIQQLKRPLERLTIEFDRLRKPALFGRALLLSFLTYSSSFSIVAILLRAVGVEVSWTTMVLLISIGMFAMAFPFNVSGFGTVELSWAFGLTLFAGYTSGEAASIGLMLNGYQILCAAVAGMLSYVALAILGRK